MMTILPFGLSLWLLSLFSRVKTWQPDYILRVSLTDIYGDCHPRHSVVVNGTSPGPLLTFQEGGHYWVRVYNDMPDRNTTIHFHGFTLYTTPFSDGTPMVSGWPIAPLAYFDYEIQLEEGFHGTFWYHSHVGMQLSTAQGPVIVERKDKVCPVDYDEEIVMMIGDYYHLDDDSLAHNILSTTHYAWMSEPQTILVNGQGYNPCDLSALKPGQICSKSCGSHLQHVRPNTRYRVRIIAGSILSYYGISLEDHQMTLFEADGTYLDPLKIDHLEIQSGQRYSMLIETKANIDQIDFQWYIQTMWRPKSSRGVAIWRYNEHVETVKYSQHPAVMAGEPPQPRYPSPYYSEQFGWILDDLREWNSSELPPGDEQVTNTIHLHGQQIVEGVGWRWGVNKAIDDEESRHEPYLINFYRPDKTTTMPDYSLAGSHGGYDPDTDTYPVPLGAVLDIVIQNHPAEQSGVVEAHPWHVHGAKFWDMGGGTGKFSYNALQRTHRHMRGRPIRRDTGVVYPGPGEVWNTTFPEKRRLEDYPGGWRLFRLKVENPGAWLVHCHLTPHAVMGMQTLFVFGAENMPSIPQPVLDRYLHFGGVPPDTDSGEPTRWFPEIQKHPGQF